MGLHKAGRETGLYEAQKMEHAPACLMRLSRTDVFHRHIHYCGYYERQISDFLLEQAQLGGTLIDVGANVGYHTCLWAVANLENKVLSFEPSPRNQELLRVNIELNELKERVQLIPSAVSNESGFAEFATGPADQTGWGGLGARSNSPTIRVKLVTLDEAVEEAGLQNGSAVLKVDVEGFDMQALQGARKLLASGVVRAVIYESSEPLAAKNSSHALLRESGYESKPISSGEFVATPVRRGSS